MVKQPPPRSDHLTPSVQKPPSQAGLVRDFLKRYTHLKTEMEELKLQIKDLEIEFEKNGVDIKTLKKALRVINIIAKVNHKDTFDAMLDQLEKELVKSAT